ncbi:hypothetical protein B5F40_15500 [Gordonibacter sp. An230]|nr:hypothetical protein B5F40_15500 [Gordonibacter sp. An230]
MRIDASVVAQAAANETDARETMGARAAADGATAPKAGAAASEMVVSVPPEAPEAQAAEKEPAEEVPESAPKATHATGMAETQASSAEKGSTITPFTARPSRRQPA